MDEVSSLLRALSRDWSDKQSVKECLRSKAVPCPEVRKAMMIADQEVDVSYQQVIEFFLPSIQQPGETLEMITRLATVFRFLQYLIEKNDNNQRIAQLLQAILSNIPVSVCSHVDRVYVCDFTETTSDQRQQLALFALGSLLRLNHYVTQKPFLLSPLWKGICDLAKALGSLPQEILQLATKSLLDLIDGGIASLPTAEDVAKQIFFAKVLTYLASRLGIIFSIGIDLQASLSERFLKTSYVLRGLKMAVAKTADEVLQQGVDQVVTKTEKCLSTWLAKRQQDDWASMLALLIATSARGINEGATSLDLAFVQGRSLTILKVIQLVTTSDSQRSLQEVDHLLALMDELLFDLLPKEWSASLSDFQNLLVQSVKTLVDALVVCDHSLQLERTSFHFLLVRWMSLSDAHPFTKEMISCILHLFTIEHCRNEENCSFLSLLVKLSTDGRTSAALVTAISNCLGRLLQSQLRDKVKSFFMDARTSILNPSYRKRKLTKQQGPSTLQVSDFAALTRLVVALPAYDAPLPVTKNSQFRQSVLEAAMMTRGLNSLIDLLLQCGKQNEHGGRPVADLGVLVLRRIRTSIEKENRPSTPDVVRLCRALEFCESLSIERISPLGLERIRVLGVIGQAITEDISAAELQKLAKSFHTLLSDENWLVCAYTMTSFVRFASTIPAVHKRFLSECVPPKAQPLFKQRLSGYIQRPGKDSVNLLRAHCTRGLLSQGLTTKCLLKKPNKVPMAVGSFVISMPTQEGRNALVIFPPGEDSIRDIEYFRNGEDCIVIQELHGITSQPEGPYHFVLRESGRP